MTENELARALFGRREQDDTVSVVVGRALTDSENGTVYVDVGGAVSGDTIVSDPETGDVSQADGASQGIEVPTPGGIKEGDVVYVIIDGSKPVNATGEGSTDAAAEAAARAEAYAEDAQQSAGAARESAESASGYATTALAGLGTVQSVADTLMWITQHGQMVLTADTEPDPTKVYFVEDEDGDYTVGGVHYSIVQVPDAGDMADYFELRVDESVQNYVTTHLAVTDDGLHVFGENGRIVVGESAGFHVVIDPTQLAFCQGMTEDEHGNPVDNRVAWVSNNELHIPRAIITEGVQVGRYRWVELDSGNFALKYVE